MKKPIIQTTINNMGTIIVIRSPLSRAWLFNLSFSHNIGESVMSLFKTTITAFVLLVFALVLIGCDTPAGNVVMPSGNEAPVSLKYIDAKYYGPSCWYPAITGGDSLNVDNRKYTISNRSRYRMATLDSEYLDVISEGDVIGGDWAIYLDTKTDSIYIFTDCVTMQEINLRGQ